jgi:hypothetical protein
VGVGRTEPSGGPEIPAAPDARVGTVRVLALVVVVALVSGLATWLISPRFELDTPSVVDDWYGVSRIPEQLRDVVVLDNPERERYRPGWIAWQALQWHTLDAPDGMVGPSLWGVLRVVILVAGLTLMTSLMLPRPRSRRGAVLHAALAAIPAFLVVVVPKFAVDLARYGPQEPLLVGGMALGGSLLALAAAPLLDPERAVPRLRTALLVIAGLGFWALGVYQKETSLAVLPLLAAVLVASRDRLVWGTLNVRRRSSLVVLGALVALPLVHVAIESLRILVRGELLYDAEVDGGLGLVSGLRLLLEWTDEALPLAGRWLVVAALLLTVAVAVIRRKVDLLALGALASGALALALAGQAGVVATRYYIPTYALFAVALALSLFRLPAPFQVAGLAALLLAFMPVAPIQDEVRAWVDDEAPEGALIRAVSELGTGCAVAADGLDLERAFAVPVLVALEQRGVERPEGCEGGATYMLVGYIEAARPLLRTCERGALELVVRGGEFMSLYRCSAIRDEPVHDPLIGRIEPEQLVALRRFRPSLDG